MNGISKEKKMSFPHLTKLRSSFQDGDVDALLGQTNGSTKATDTGANKDYAERLLLSNLDRKKGEKSARSKNVGAPVAENGRGAKGEGSTYHIAF
jgi:hypothetical protein